MSDLNTAKNNNRPQDAPGSCWVFYGDSKEAVIRIQKEVSYLFSNSYTFFPETDWGKCGYKPPEGHQVFGAWRHPEAKAFVFLLDNPKMVTIKPNIQLILYVTGDRNEISRLSPECEELKLKFSKNDKKYNNTIENDTKLTKIRKSKPLAVIYSVLTIFTAVINVFSLYIRKLPPPEMTSELFTTIYLNVLSIVHFSALVLLLLVILILILFVLKYGILLMRHLS